MQTVLAQPDNISVSCSLPCASAENRSIAARLGREQSGRAQRAEAVIAQNIKSDAAAGGHGTIGNSDVEPAKAALIKELLEVSRATRNAQLGYDTVVQQQMRGLHVALNDRIDGDTSMNEEQKQEAKRVLLLHLNKRMAHTKELMQEKVDLSKLVADAYIKLYDKYFSTQEIKDMLAWYKSPTGQRMLDTLPNMTQEMMTLVNASLMPKLKEIDEQMMSEEKQGKFN